MKQKYSGNPRNKLNVNRPFTRKTDVLWDGWTVEAHRIHKFSEKLYKDLENKTEKYDEILYELRLLREEHSFQEVELKSVTSIFHKVNVERKNLANELLRVKEYSNKLEIFISRMDESRTQVLKIDSLLVQLQNMKDNLQVSEMDKNDKDKKIAKIERENETLRQTLRGSDNYQNISQSKTPIELLKYEEMICQLGAQRADICELSIAFAKSTEEVESLKIQNKKLQDEIKSVKNIMYDQSLEHELEIDSIKRELEFCENSKVNLRYDDSNNKKSNQDTYELEYLRQYRDESENKLREAEHIINRFEKLKETENSQSQQFVREKQHLKDEILILKKKLDDNIQRCNEISRSSVNQLNTLSKESTALIQESHDRERRAIKASHDLRVTMQQVINERNQALDSLKVQKKNMSINDSTNYIPEQNISQRNISTNNTYNSIQNTSSSLPVLNARSNDIEIRNIDISKMHTSNQLIENSSQFEASNVSKDWVSEAESRINAKGLLIDRRRTNTPMSSIPLSKQIQNFTLSSSAIQSEMEGDVFIDSNWPSRMTIESCGNSDVEVDSEVQLQVDDRVDNKNSKSFDLHSDNSFKASKVTHPPIYDTSINYISNFNNEPRSTLKSTYIPDSHVACSQSTLFHNLNDEKVHEKRGGNVKREEHSIPSLFDLARI